MHDWANQKHVNFALTPIVRNTVFGEGVDYAPDRTKMSNADGRRIGRR
jgi:hypothetical protein